VGVELDEATLPVPTPPGRPMRWPRDAGPGMLSGTGRHPDASAGTATDMEDPMAEGLRLLDRIADAASVRRAFGDPTERDGCLIIPVARISGGGGGGEGGRGDGAEAEQGSGGGFGLRVTPSGVFVLRDGTVSWQPAVDVNRAILGGQLIAALALLTLRAALRRRNANSG
jgi:uncharacterized spore protein YtfJ